jgi:phage-related baseplate assembly protein
MGKTMAETKETFPRWNLPGVDFLETDASAIKSGIILGYEAVAKRSLADGDPVRLFLLTVADVIIQLRNKANIAAQQNILSYARGEYLDAYGVNMACPRLGESYAITTFQFTLAQALGSPFVIPAGFEITNGIITFATDAELIIETGQTTGTMTATCTTPGKDGNEYLPGQIDTIVRPLTFLAAAVNTVTTSGGADEEDDAKYAARLRLAPNAFSVAGPTKAYLFHTYSANPAIIDVEAVSPEPGEVDVYPLLVGGMLPTQDVLDAVAEYLNGETIRPLTDYVQVLEPEAVNYAINVEYWISNNDRASAETIKTNVIRAVEEYRLWQQTKLGRDIQMDKLISMVIDAGAARVDMSTISPSTYQTLDRNQVAQCTGVTITYRGFKDD